MSIPSLSSRDETKARIEQSEEKMRTFITRLKELNETSQKLLKSFHKPDVSNSDSTLQTAAILIDAIEYVSEVKRVQTVENGNKETAEIKAKAKAIHQEAQKLKRQIEELKAEKLKLVRALQVHQENTQLLKDRVQQLNQINT